MEATTINYNLNLGDYLHFYKAQHKKKHILFKKRMYPFAFILSVILYLYIEKRQTDNPIKFDSYLLINFTLIFFAFFLSIFLFRAIVLNRIERNLFKMKKLFGHKKVELIDDTIRTTSNETSITYSLNYFDRLDFDKKYYYLYAEGKNAIMIPKNTNNIDEFIKLIVSKTGLTLNEFLKK